MAHIGAAFMMPPQVREAGGGVAALQGWGASGLTQSEPAPSCPPPGPLTCRSLAGLTQQVSVWTAVSPPKSPKG